MEVKIGDVGPVGSGSTINNLKIYPYPIPPGEGTNVINVSFPPILTKGEKLKQKISYWMNRMGLLEWTVWGEFVPPEEDSSARCIFDPLHYQATIYLSDEHPEEQWDWSVVHELLHLMLSPIDAYIDELLLHTEKREQVVLDSHKEPIVEAVFNRLCRAIVGSS